MRERFTTGTLFSSSNKRKTNCNTKAKEVETIKARVSSISENDSSVFQANRSTDSRGYGA